MFWEILVFQLHYTAKLLPLAIFEKLIFLKNPPFFSKQLKFFWGFWENLLIPSHSTAYVNTSEIWKIQGFFGKRIFFSKKPNLWEFWEIRRSRSHSTSNWLTSTAFKKFKFFSRKTICFLESKSWTFREIFLIQSMLRQVCYL